MIHYERRVSLGKLDIWGVDDWPVWVAEFGMTERKVQVFEEYVLQEGRLRLQEAGGEVIELGSGDWFRLEPGTVCTMEVLEAVEGFRQAEPLA